jgi:hypothetical protein
LEELFCVRRISGLDTEMGNHSKLVKNKKATLIWWRDYAMIMPTKPRWVLIPPGPDSPSCPRGVLFC